MLCEKQIYREKESETERRTRKEAQKRETEKKEDNEGGPRETGAEGKGRGRERAGDVCTLKYYSQMKYRAGPAGTQRARIYF